MAADDGTCALVAGATPLQVSVATFTTECAAANCSVSSRYVPGDDPSCIWLPDGTVLPGANRTLTIPSPKTLYDDAPNTVKNGLWGTVRVDYVASLPNIVQQVCVASGVGTAIHPSRRYLEGLGIQSVNPKLSRDIHGTELVNSDLSFAHNALTSFRVQLSDELRSLDLSFNQIQAINISAGYHSKLASLYATIPQAMVRRVGRRDLASNGLTSDMLRSAIIPSSVVTLWVCLAKTGTQSFVWHRNLANNSLTTFPTEVLGRFLSLNTL
ncbi:hypothetical protein ACHHYP_13073 [Achlya hypogyna]|uniref:Uncharacterized protein n=1 Tax=Achlya hypogyna TaxID=1202772 RepID=A0A1V9YG02_ACHHY|nr:hypothetical protein ACHHYP_13073 [Achlya hypogyna]